MPVGFAEELGEDMSNGNIKKIMMSFVVFGLAAQEPTVLDTQGIRQALATEKDKVPVADSTPKVSDNPLAKTREDGGSGGNSDLSIKILESRRLAAELRALKERENAPRRFAEDLFDFREPMPDVTEGGIPDDYVLGIGDKLQVLGFGSATFELGSQVDGRGTIVIPKVGTLKVAGLTLGKAKTAAQAMVARQLAGTNIDMTVTKLREVRVFILGEVYRPGSYMVANLSSLVNVLSMAGGPTALGTFRQIRVLRGGQIVHQVDLYPLRSDGQGNMNFPLQGGDTIFVPLAFNQIMLEGSFVRVAGSLGQNPMEMSRFPQSLALSYQSPTGGRFSKVGQAPGQSQGQRQGQDQSPSPNSGQNPNPAQNQNIDQSSNKVRPPSMGQAPINPQSPYAGQSPYPGQIPAPGQVPPSNQTFSAPSVLSNFPISGSMQFELLPGETAEDALRFAGGLQPNAYRWGLTLRRQDDNGVTNGLDIPLGQLNTIQIRRGDILSALPRMDRVERLVSVGGWVRVPGNFARSENLRVGELLKLHSQVMPDTYLKRGDIVRTLPDNSTQYLGFNVAKALAGDPANDLLLSDRDRITLYPVDRMRTDEQVTLSGPFTNSGTYTFHEGMRVADLVFLAGIPKKEANRMVAELARTRLGAPSEVRRLDLAKLISTEDGSPVNFQDDSINPLLKDDDQISIFEKPQFRVHRSVRIQGQVANPGTYVFTEEHPTLSTLIERAGGVTQNGMANAGILLRSIGMASAADITVSDLSGVSEILDRLNETKLIDPNLSAKFATSGSNLQSTYKVPVLHGLSSAKLNRVVVDFLGAIAKKPDADLELNDNDEVIIPRKTDTAMILGETATPFAFYKVTPGLKVGEMIKQAGGTTRNADTWNIRLLKADGRIVENWVNHQRVDPGDTVLVPQKVRRDVPWQETLTALTPLAILIDAVRR